MGAAFLVLTWEMGLIPQWQPTNTWAPFTLAADLLCVPGQITSFVSGQMDQQFLIMMASVCVLRGGKFVTEHLGQLFKLCLLLGFWYVPSTQCGPNCWSKLLVHVVDDVRCHPDLFFRTKVFIPLAVGSVGRCLSAESLSRTCPQPKQPSLSRSCRLPASWGQLATNSECGAVNTHPFCLRTGQLRSGIRAPELPVELAENFVETSAPFNSPLCPIPLCSLSSPALTPSC